jgi:8-oxo-dGTP diphosphatase
VTIFLTRHAHAGKRSAWQGDDSLRPLSERGITQALDLAKVLAGETPRRLVSSPFVRCLQTLEPLGTRMALEVEPDATLAEGGDVDRALALLLSLDPVDGVACSHGDLIPPLLRALRDLGMTTDGPLLNQKGSLWVIETSAGRPTIGTYQPPTH